MDVSDSSSEEGQYLHVCVSLLNLFLRKQVSSSFHLSSCDTTMIGSLFLVFI